MISKNNKLFNPNYSPIYKNHFLRSRPFVKYHYKKEMIKYSTESISSNKKQINEVSPDDWKEFDDYKQIYELMEKSSVIGMNKMNLNPIDLCIHSRALSLKGFTLLMICLVLVYNKAKKRSKKEIEEGWIDINLDEVNEILGDMTYKYKKFVNKNESLKEYRFSGNTLYEAVKELKNADILANTDVVGRYWYNHTLFFKGNYSEFYKNYLRACRENGITVNKSAVKQKGESLLEEYLGSIDESDLVN